MTNLQKWINNQIEEQTGLNLKQKSSDNEGRTKGLKKNRAKEELRTKMAENNELDEFLGEEWHVKVGNEYYPRNQVPMSKHEQFKKENPGAIVRFRGPRGKSEDGGNKAHTLKANATHFYVVYAGNNRYGKPKLNESLAGEARAAEYEFAMNGAIDNYNKSNKSIVRVPSHAIKVGSTHFHPGKKGMKLAILRAKALGVKPKIVKNPGGFLLGESTEESELVEDKLPDWARAEFDAAFKKSSNSHNPNNDEPHFARFNPRIDGKYKVQTFPKGRVHMGTYGKSAIIDDEDEYPAGNPQKHSQPAKSINWSNDNPMIPKVKTSQAQIDAGPQRPRGRAATPEAMAKYRKLLRDRSMKKESYIYNGESFVSLNESFAKEIAENVSDQVKKLTKEAIELDSEIILDIIKEGQIFNYKIMFGDETIYEGIGSTVSGILAESNRKMSKLKESILQKEGQLDRIKNIAKRYIK
jgi:hypothetical protein